MNPVGNLLPQYLGHFCSVRVTLKFMGVKTVTMKSAIFIAALLPAFASFAGDYTLTPDGSYVAGDTYTLAPDGSYVSGDSYSLTPDDSYVSGDTYTLAPDGSYVSGDTYTLTPDGSYVSGDTYTLTRTVPMWATMVITLTPDGFAPGLFQKTQ